MRERGKNFMPSLNFASHLPLNAAFTYTCGKKKKKFRTVVGGGVR